jgi:Restriction endonuclease
VATLAKDRKVRYIKLGEHGRWERPSIERGRLHFGYDMADARKLALARVADWSGLTRALRSEGHSEAAATRITNQMRVFFEDDGSILWLTFSGQRLFWGHVGPERPLPEENGDGIWRPMEGGWRPRDPNEPQLTKANLSGQITKLALYRGTSCWVDDHAADYITRRIEGRPIPQVEQARALARELRGALTRLLQLLEPRDFETLVELVFEQSGWRRLAKTGGVEKGIDLDLQQPITGERAFVQVKSRTSQEEFDALCRGDRRDRSLRPDVLRLSHGAGREPGRPGHGSGSRGACRPSA